MGEGTLTCLRVTPRLRVWFPCTNATPGLYILPLCTAFAFLGCSFWHLLCKWTRAGNEWCLWTGDGSQRGVLSLQKEEKPPVVSVSTVDYGVLEFQWDPHTQLPPETCPDDQTEYATIIFPEEKPVTPERGKRHLDERTWQPPSQPC